MYFCFWVFRQYHLFIFYYFSFIVPNLYSCILFYFSQYLYLGLSYQFAFFIFIVQYISICLWFSWFWQISPFTIFYMFSVFLYVSYLFHFIDFSILLCFFSFSVVTRLLLSHFLCTLLIIILIYFCGLYLFLWQFSFFLYSPFTFWHCGANSILHKHVLYNALAYLSVNYFIFNCTHRPYNQLCKYYSILTLHVCSCKYIQSQTIKVSFYLMFEREIQIWLKV